MDYEQALAWVHSLPRLAARPGVENERKLLEKLGHPEERLCFAHIAGTNGKGSTAVMLAGVLQKAGYRVGLTVSPYVLDFRERFQVDGQMIEPAALAEVLTEVRAAAEALAAEGWDSLVEFDAVTAAALVWFARRQCDIVVLPAMPCRTRWWPASPPSARTTPSCWAIPMSRSPLKSAAF